MSGSEKAPPIASVWRALPARHLRASPDLVEAATRDLQGIAVHDPATSGFLPPLLNFKGYVALQAWRVSNWLWREGRTDLALLLQSLSSDQLQVSIHPSASIGTSVFLDHATGIIIGAFAVIGDEVTILQNVTIGRKPSDAGPGSEDRPRRSAQPGATVIGDVSIGDFAKIGAGAVVEHDVPGGCTAVGVPARLTNCPEDFGLSACGNCSPGGQRGAANARPMTGSATPGRFPAYRSAHDGLQIYPRIANYFTMAP